MVESFNSRITQLGENFAESSKQITTNNINKSGYDKTFIGRVVDKNAKLTNDGKTRLSSWVVVAGGTTYTIKVENCDIKSIGQKVRLYVPNNKRENAYAEVINAVQVPDGITYMKDVLNPESEWYNEDYSDYMEFAMTTETSAQSKKDGKIQIDVIVEKWLLPDMTFLERTFVVTIEKDMCTNLICPDGKVINLIGW